MGKLIFLRRTEREIQVFGGDVYIDIDGKNVGILSRTDQEYDVTAGKHTIKMYKSHSYGTFIGFAESTISVEQDEKLMVRYAGPMSTNQSGNLIITAYNDVNERKLLEERDAVIKRDYENEQHRKEEQNNKYNTGLIIFILFIIVDAIIWAVWMSSI